MKIFMHWDMEGACGIFNRAQTWYWEKKVRKEVAEKGRNLLIADVNSAVAAALKAGVDKIIVSDTHRGGGNLKPEKMLKDRRVRYNLSSRGFCRNEYRWMPGLDGSVDGFMLPAHHSKAGTGGAFLPHTQTLEWADVSINGQSVGEMGIEACFAAHWDIPVIMMHGDEAACREAGKQFPWIVAVSVKRALSPGRCTGPEPQKARELVAEGVIKAIEKLRAGKCKPFKPKLPMTVSVKMRESRFAEKAARRPTVKRVDEFTVQGYAQQYCDILKWLYGIGLNMTKPR